jgi:hypothetical protein
MSLRELQRFSKKPILRSGSCVAVLRENGHRIPFLSSARLLKG